MRFFDTECTFKYPWEQVTRANWNKYPNEITTHVETVDVLRREVDPMSGVLRTERLIGCRQPLPRWISSWCSHQSVAYMREVSEVDPRTKTLTMRTRNLDHSQILSVQETVIYKPHSASEDLTQFTQTATFVSSLSWDKLCNKIEDFGVKRFIQNAQLGRTAFESVLESVSALADDVTATAQALHCHATSKSSAHQT